MKFRWFHQCREDELEIQRNGLYKDYLKLKNDHDEAIKKITHLETVIADLNARSLLTLPNYVEQLPKVPDYSVPEYIARTSSNTNKPKRTRKPT